MENENKLIPISTNNMVQKVSTSIAITNKLITENNKQLVREIFQRNPQLFVDLISEFYKHEIISIEYKDILLKQQNNNNTRQRKIVIVKGILLKGVLNNEIRFNSKKRPFRTVEVEVYYPDNSTEICDATLFESLRVKLSEGDEITLFVQVGGEYDGYAQILKTPIYNKKNKINNQFFQIQYNYYGIYNNEKCNNYAKKIKNELNKNNNEIIFFLNRNHKKINWQLLSIIPNLKWTEKLIEVFLKDWNWEGLSTNEALPWSEKFINKHQDKWDWENLSYNKYLPWSQNFIEKYQDKWNFEYGLSYNERIPWSVKLIHKYSEKLSSSENIWNTLKPYIDDEMVIELLKEIKAKTN